ncbi:hypothetical protein [Endozoicomonas sp.]|uniref:COG4648 family protein n=1 Tax=Endozoicomonas sp. TaxID=1892382 RepID=UPI002888DC59|nr:hypothetical protein [Endozoicomonas sp.]
MIKRVWQVILGILLACYPLVIYLGLETMPLNRVAALILGLFLLRLLALKGSRLRFLRHLTIPAALGGIALSSAALFLNSQQALLLYPVLVSIAGFSVFTWSLIKPPSIIECFARLQEETLTEQAVVYTRKVTMIWCLFFTINGSIALFTVISNDQALWALYNGLISYLLMGTLLGGEWLYRKWILKV